MNKFAALLPAVFLGLATVAGANEFEPGEPGSLLGRWSGGRFFGGGSGNDQTAPLYYKPTQRYYGPGYTISYRYVPVFQSGYSGTPGSATYVSSNFPTERYHIATEDIPSYGTSAPRLTVKDPKSAAPRAAVTSIVRKKTSNRTPSKSDAPVIIPSTTETPAPVVAPTEAPKP